MFRLVKGLLRQRRQGPPYLKAKKKCMARDMELYYRLNCSQVPLQNADGITVCATCLPYSRMTYMAREDLVLTGGRG